MNKLFAAIKRSPKRVAAITVVAAAVLVPAALFAWGPDRPTYTIEQPADHVVFNSITNNPAHGDERNFVQIKEASASNSTYAEEVALQPGKEYEVFVYFHNNASSTLNDAAHQYKGIALNTKMRVQMPASVQAGEKARFTGIVSADNANPQQVWDEAYGSSSSAVALRYVQNSAVIHSFGAVNGKTLPDSLVSTGTPLGYNALDGKVPGCNEFSGYVTFRFKVDQPNFSVEKTVSKSGQNAFSKSVTAQPNEEVEYKIQYKNTGTTQQNDVVIKDQLPAGITYVPGSAVAASSASGGNYVKVSDNVVTSGINIGAYAPNGNAFVRFKAKVVDNSKLENCGVNTLVNKAIAETNNGSKSDTANVVVSKTCNQPAYTCDSISASKISRTQYSFTAHATASNGATITGYTFNFGDNTAPVTSTNATVNHTYAAAGTYTVVLTANFKVNGEDKTATSASCKVMVTVVPEECKPGVPVGDSRCEDKCLVPGKEHLPANSPDCKQENCTVPGKEHLPKNSPDCVAPVSELPQTGLDDGVATFAGLGILTAGLGYALTSSRIRKLLIG